ncbi:MAG: NADP-dependent malic enzyme [Bacteroidales bacterium]|nr:NADP-dependent malic enzyme [Bacteroidales bacterium]
MKWREIEHYFPKDLSAEKLARFKTVFYQRISLEAHKLYRGKLQTLPQVPVDSIESLNVWYTPGVSAVSTAIRSDNHLSFQLTGRANRVAIVSDSTRVLGDGDCTPAGGLGVMEGKALLMRQLGGIDAIPLCINNRDENGEPNPDKVIDFVKMVAPSFGAINLEDISQPNCFKILDTLTEECEIPVWHDDAQGSACAVLAGLINALKLTKKELKNCKIVLYGAGAANTAVAHLLIAAGASASKIILFDSKGVLHRDRDDYRDKSLGYKQWDLCQITNGQSIKSHEEAFKDADIVIALSKPGPDTLKPEWIASMAQRPIVFACANPIPEIYPHDARRAGAYIVATGRGDFPNQINNSIVFPALLKGVLTVAATKITDNMVLAAAKAIASFAEKQGLTPEHIVPNMLDQGLCPMVASAVAEAATEDGVARNPMEKNEVEKWVQDEIYHSQMTTQLLMEKGVIKEFPESLVKKIVNEVKSEIIK